MGRAVGIEDYKQGVVERAVGFAAGCGSPGTESAGTPTLPSVGVVAEDDWVGQPKLARMPRVKTIPAKAFHRYVVMVR